MIWKLIVLAAVLAIGVTRLAGGWMEADINYPGVQEALDFAVAEHPNIGINNEVISVRIQVVAGLNYNITVKMQEEPNMDQYYDADRIIMQQGRGKTC